jgi:hypothetical protein
MDDYTIALSVTTDFAVIEMLLHYQWEDIPLIPHEEEKESG